VIVVSEETGIISLAMNGQLIRNISEAQLRRHLNTAVVKTTPLLERLGRWKQDEHLSVNPDEQVPPAASS
jgi:hypothetical protein